MINHGDTKDTEGHKGKIKRRVGPWPTLLFKIFSVNLCVLCVSVVNSLPRRQILPPAKEKSAAKGSSSPYMGFSRGSSKGIGSLVVRSR